MTIRASSTEIRSTSVMSTHFLVTVPANSGPEQWAPRALINFGTLVPAANKFGYYTDANSGALADFTATGRSLVAAGNVNSVMGLLSTKLHALDAPTYAANKLPYATDAGSFALADFTATGRSLVAAGNVNSVIGLLSTKLNAFNAPTYAANKLPYATHADSFALADFTDAGRSLVAIANVSSGIGLWGLTGIQSWNVATKADWMLGTNSRLLTAEAVYAAQAEVAITDAATVVINLSSGHNYVWTLGGANRSVAVTSLGKIGQTGRIRFIQSGAAACSLSFHTTIKWHVASPARIAVNSGACAVVYYDCVASDYIIFNWAGDNVK